MTSQNNNSLKEIITFNDILAPLMLVISENVGIANNKESCDVEVLVLAKLVENVVELTNKYVAKNKPDDDLLKWIIAGNISRIVAAHYKNKKGVLETELNNINMEEIQPLDQFSTEEEFKNAIFESMAPIVNVIGRFNFAIDEKKIISGVEKHISLYADNLFSSIKREDIGSEYFNSLYIKTIRNLTSIFDMCYYNEIDATISVPSDKREGFIQKHIVDAPDSVNKLLDNFYARVATISNISVSLGKA